MNTFIKWRVWKFVDYEDRSLIAASQLVLISSMLFQTHCVCLICQANSTKGHTLSAIAIYVPIIWNISARTWEKSSSSFFFFPRLKTFYSETPSEDLFLHRFKWCGPFIKSSLNLLQYCFCFIWVVLLGVRHLGS